MNIHSHLKTFIHNKLLYYQCQTIKGVQLFKTPLLCGKNTPLGIEIPCCSRSEQAPKRFLKRFIKIY
ncbi:hypothetical protein GBF26_11260 [Staphylococcus aureus]|nr:hypothetical protein [Staphylococcus aureus]MUG43311.1 hypothetical protein [Staphylococcus aureus]MUG58937.1 hypothetical protein [Staphylococcus aureus]MUG61230.1 hypothetical protein [Staphylococcus aureus]MUG84594.1 hypothetical protein [Staphylococcus aureus]